MRLRQREEKRGIRARKVGHKYTRRMFVDELMGLGDAGRYGDVGGHGPRANISVPMRMRAAERDGGQWWVV